MSVDSGMQDLLGYPRFSEQDLAYPDRLLLKLRESRDPVSEYLRKRCDPDMGRLIEEFDRLPAGAEVKWNVLVNGLNRLLEEPHLFDEDRFAQVKLRNETQKLLNPKLNYEELLRRNRLLIEDAYPEEIVSGAHDSLTPEVPTPTNVETMSSSSQPDMLAEAEQPNEESNGLNNPFPGLRPFETNEYHLFFGRDGQSDELIERLGRTHFLAVVGTSGSGKSSLVRAGLLPALYGGLMPQVSSAWRVALFRPGDDPLGELATALGAIEVLGVAGADPLVEIAMMETCLRRSALGLIDAVRQTRLGDHESVLVVVDQFEELFRFKEAIEGPEDDATAFVKLLLEAGAQREFPIYVVITMRSDYLGDCAQFRNLPEAINLGQYLIPRMTRDERREAITGPVAVAGGEMTVPLINLLLNDVGDNPDQLPILQHALMRSWNHWKLHKRNGQPLDIEDYEAVGGMERSLSNHAKEAYGELDRRQQEIAEKVFKALTEKGADNREIRRPTPLRELCAIAEASEEEVVSIIEIFRGGDRSFLMPPKNVTLDAVTVIDISHESLIRNWMVLQSWVGEEAESARMYRRLADAAKAFGGSHLPDSLLDSALDWRERNQPNAAWAERYCSADQAEVVFEEVMAFIDSSRDARVARIKEDERLRNEEVVRQRRELEQAAALADKERRLAESERQQAEDRATAQQRALEQAQDFAEHQARAVRRLRLLAVGMAVMFLLAVATAGYAMVQRRQARVNEQTALTREQEAADALKQMRIAEQGRERAYASETAAQLARKGALEEALAEKERADEQKLIAEQRAAEAIVSERKARLAEVEANKRARALEANGLFRDATILAERSEFEKASENFTRTIERLQEPGINDFEGVADTYVQLGQTYFGAIERPDMKWEPDWDRVKQGLKAYDKAEEFYVKKAGSPDKAAAALLSVGETLFKIAKDENVGRSVSNSEKELARFSLKDPPRVISGIQENVDVKVLLKNQALERHKRAFQLYRQSGNVEGMRRAAYSIGAFYLREQLSPEQDTTPVVDLENCAMEEKTQGNKQKALCYFKELERLSLQQRKDDADIYPLLILIGSLNYERGRPEAEAYFQRAELAYRTQRSRSGREGGPWASAAFVSQNEALYDAALFLYKRALNAYLDAGNHYQVANMYYKQGDILRKHDPRSAIGYTFDVTELFKKAVEAYKLSIPNLEYGLASDRELLDIGAHAEEVNDKELALDTYRVVLAMGEALRDVPMQARAWAEIGRLQTQASPKEARQSYMRAFELYSRRRTEAEVSNRPWALEDGNRALKEMNRIVTAVQSLDKEIKLQAAAAQETLTAETFCPYPLLVYPEKPVYQEQEPIVFKSSSADGGTSQLKLSWQIIPAPEKIFGSGKDIVFITKGLGGQRLTATLVADNGSGLAVCRQTAQASTSIAAPKPTPK